MILKTNALVSTSGMHLINDNKLKQQYMYAASKQREAKAKTC